MRKTEENANASSMLVRCASLLRSEEHTSELQSQSNLVCRLLLEKKKQRTSLIRCLHHLSRDRAVISYRAPVTLSSRSAELPALLQSPTTPQSLPLLSNI